ncbi:hypothetical protein Tco_1171132, partial [Tanacetum coccineum]
IIMSDLEHSTVTYTSVSIPVEDDSDVGSPGVDGPPIMPEDPYAYIMAAYGVPPSPDYIPGPKGPPSLDYMPGPEEPEQAPPSPIYLPYVPEPVYPEYIPPEDDVFLAEEQLLHAATSPTAESPGYIPESDPEEDPEEDPADYPTDREDDDDDEDEDEDEEEEHPALADSVPPVHRMTARISIRDEPSISLPPREEIPSPTPNSPTHIDIPKSCLPLQKRVRFASPTPRREVGESSAAGAARQDRPTIARDDPYSIAREDLYRFVDIVDVPPRCSTSKELDYDITDTWDELVGAINEIAPTTLEGVNLRVTDLATIVKEETTSMYGIIEDAQDDRSQLRGRVNRLCTFRCYVITYYGSGIECIDFRVTVSRSQTQIMAATKAVMDRKSLAQPDCTRIGRLLADCIDLLFCLATQYRSFVQKMAPKRKTTRLNPDATPTPVTDTHTTTSVTNAQIQAMINEGVTAALAARDATRNGDDSHTSGTGARRPVQVARECTYPEFLKCQPLNFKGTKGVVGLTQWFEKMESVYSISNCTVACQVIFSMCTLQGNALTWWNSHVKTTTPEAAHSMPWRTLKKMMTDKYCPRGEIKNCVRNVEFEADKQKKSDDLPRKQPESANLKQRDNTLEELMQAGNAFDRKPYGGLPRSSKMSNTGAIGLFRGLVVLMWCLMGISRRIAPKIDEQQHRVIRLGNARLQGKGCIAWAMQGQTRTTMSSRVSSLIWEAGDNKKQLFNVEDRELCSAPILGLYLWESEDFIRILRCFKEGQDVRGLFYKRFSFYDPIVDK